MEDIRVPIVAKIQAMAYKTLDLYIRKQGKEDFIEALGPEGEWAESCTEIPDNERRKAIIQEISTEYTRETYDQIGDQLGKALMAGSILQLYISVLQRTLARPNQGLRLKLHFIGVAKVYEKLPWELIRINGISIAMDPRQSIVRTVDLLEPAIPLAVEKLPYRILVITEQIKDYQYPSLQVEKEGERIKEALKPLLDNGLIQIESRHNATITQVEGILREGGFHIVHFAGLGILNEQGNGVLAFVDNAGEADFIDGRRLGGVLLGTGVLMAFLNSCETAYGKGSGSGVAEALLQVGLPLVAACNYTIGDNSAITYANAFYSELVKTNSIDQAMFAGRRAIIEFENKFERYSWPSPVLFTRTLDGKFWSGEAGYQVETFIKGGRIVTEARKQGDFDPIAFAGRLQDARESMKSLMTLSDQVKVRQLISEAEEATANSEIQQASQKLSEASTHIYLTLINQEKRQNNERNEKNARLTVLCVSLILLFIVAILGYALRDTWTPSMSIPVVAIPVSVLVWSFIGGVAAMLQTFVGTKNIEETLVKRVNYEWLLWRPIVGVIMGSVLYLAISAGLVVLGVGDTTSLANARNTYFLWALAFLGGFSDKFTIIVFDNIVRTFSKSQDKSQSGINQESD